jgi:hypothetical protein
MASPKTEDDLTDEEIAEFEGIGEDDRKKLERYLKWQEKQKENEDALRSGKRAYSLDDLEAMLDNPRTASFLKHALAEREANPPKDSKQLKKSPTQKSGSLFSVIGGKKS